MDPTIYTSAPRKNVIMRNLSSILIVLSLCSALIITVFIERHRSKDTPTSLSIYQTPALPNCSLTVNDMISARNYIAEYHKCAERANLSLFDENCIVNNNWKFSGNDHDLKVRQALATYQEYLKALEPPLFLRNFHQAILTNAKKTAETFEDETSIEDARRAHSDLNAAYKDPTVELCYAYFFEFIPIICQRDYKENGSGVTISDKTLSLVHTAIEAQFTYVLPDGRTLKTILNNKTLIAPSIHGDWLDDTLRLRVTVRANDMREINGLFLADQTAKRLSPLDLDAKYLCALKE